MSKTIDELTQRTISANLSAIRTRRKLSFAETGRRAKTSAGAIRDIELNGRVPGACLLVRIADSLSVPVSALFKKPKKSTNRA